MRTLLIGCTATLMLLTAGICHAEDAAKPAEDNSDIGIASCDKFVAWMQNCVDKHASEKSKPDSLKVLGMMKSGYKTEVEEKRDPNTISKECEKAATAWSAAMKSKGCAAYDPNK